MNELKKKIAAIRLRLKFFRAIDWALWALIGALTALCLTFLILNLFANNVDRNIVAASVVGGALLIAVIAGLAKQLTLFEAALQTDSRLKLRERISSAVLLEQVHQDGTDAFHALEEDAKQYATAIKISKDFPYKFPRHGWHTAWPAIGLIALYFMPQMDLFATPKAQGTKKDPEPVMTTEERKKKAETLQQLAKKARPKEAEDIAAAKDDLKLADKLERLSEDVSKGAKNDKEMLAEMSRLKDDASLKQKEMNSQMQPFKQIKGLQEADQTRDLQKDLKDQDFKAAAEKMQQLAQQMMKPEEMSADDKKELAEEMQNLAQQLKDNPQMADAIQKAAEAIKQAAEQEQQQQDQAQQEEKKDDPSGSNSEKKDGQKEDKQTASSGQQQSQQQQQKANQQNAGQSSKSDAASQQKAQQAAQAAQAAMQQAAQQMQNMQDMQQQMQQLSELQAQMAQAMASSMSNSSQSQSKSQAAQQQSGQSQQGQGQQPGQQPGGDKPGQGMGQGQQSNQGGNGNVNGPGNFQQGYSDNQGQNGPGGLGRGSGFRPDSGKTADGFVDTFIPGQKNEGQIIAVFDVDAPAPKGESNLRYTSVPSSYEQRAADAMTDTEIPVGMRNSVKDYFERINFGKQGGEAQPAGPQQPAAAAPPQPAQTK